MNENWEWVATPSDALRKLKQDPVMKLRGLIGVLQPAHAVTPAAKAAVPSDSSAKKWYAIVHFLYIRYAFMRLIYLCLFEPTNLYVWNTSKYWSEPMAIKDSNIIIYQKLATILEICIFNRFILNSIYN